METIIEFKGKESLAEHQVWAISEIVFDSFEQKFLAVSSRISREKWITILSKILTFNSGLYFEKDGKIVGAALLTSKEASSFMSLWKIISLLGLINALFLWIIFISPVKLEDEIKVELLAVNSAVRGIGVGGKLLDELIRLAQRENYGQISLEVVDTNPRAKKLYEKIGFKTVKEVKTYKLTEKAGFKAYDLMMMRT